MILTYEGLDALPESLRIYGASDYATMEARAGKDTRGAASPSKRQQFARQQIPPIGLEGGRHRIHQRIGRLHLRHLSRPFHSQRYL